MKDITTNENLIFKSSFSFSSVLITLANSVICALILAQILNAIITIGYTSALVVSSIITLAIMIPLVKFTRRAFIYTDRIVLSNYYNGNNVVFYPHDISSVDFRTPKNGEFTIIIFTKSNKKYSSELGGLTDEDYKKITEVLTVMGIYIEKKETFWTFMKFDKEEK